MVADFLGLTCDVVGQLAVLGQASPLPAHVAAMMRRHCIGEIVFRIQRALEKRPLRLVGNEHGKVAGGRNGADETGHRPVETRIRCFNSRLRASHASRVAGTWKGKYPLRSF